MEKKNSNPAPSIACLVIFTLKLKKKQKNPTFLAFRVLIPGSWSGQKTHNICEHLLGHSESQLGLPNVSPTSGTHRQVSSWLEQSGWQLSIRKSCRGLKVPLSHGSPQSYPLIMRDPPHVPAQGHLLERPCSLTDPGHPADHRACREMVWVMKPAGCGLMAREVAHLPLQLLTALPHAQQHEGLFMWHPWLLYPVPNFPWLFPQHWSPCVCCVSRSKGAERWLSPVNSGYLGQCCWGGLGQMEMIKLFL